MIKLRDLLNENLPKVKEEYKKHDDKYTVEKQAKFKRPEDFKETTDLKEEDGQKEVNDRNEKTALRANDYQPNCDDTTLETKGIQFEHDARLKMYRLKEGTEMGAADDHPMEKDGPAPMEESGYAVTVGNELDEKAKLGSGARFAAIEKSAKASGADDPAAVAAAAGIKAHGKKKMEKWAHAGRK